MVARATQPRLRLAALAVGPCAVRREAELVRKAMLASQRVLQPGLRTTPWVALQVALQVALRVALRAAW